MWWISCEHDSWENYVDGSDGGGDLHGDCIDNEINADMLRFKVFVMYNAEIQKAADKADMCSSSQCGANFWTMHRQEQEPWALSCQVCAGNTVVTAQIY